MRFRRMERCCRAWHRPARAWFPSNLCQPQFALVRPRHALPPFRLVQTRQRVHALAEPFGARFRALLPRRSLAARCCRLAFRHPLAPRWHRFLQVFQRQPRRLLHAVAQPPHAVRRLRLCLLACRWAELALRWW